MIWFDISAIIYSMIQQPGLFRKNARNPYVEYTENNIVNYVLSGLSLSCNAWRTNSGRIDRDDLHVKLAPKGTADVIGYHRRNGKFVAVECKKRTGKLSFEQELFIDAVKAAGGYAFVVYSTEDVDQVCTFLNKEGMKRGEVF